LQQQQQQQQQEQQEEEAGPAEDTFLGSQQGNAMEPYRPHTKALAFV
jgi:hypothetical protein